MTRLMTPFEFEKPSNIEQVFELLVRLKTEQKKYLFGGGTTDLLPMFKKGINQPDCLISLTGLTELKGIDFTQHKVRIGAATRLAEIVKNDQLKQYFPELCRAAGLVASPQIRNQATIGGNILVDNRCIYVNQSETNRSCHNQCFKAGGEVCHLVKSAKLGDETLCQARFVSDTAPILILLEAVLVIRSVDTTRSVLLKDFYCKEGIKSNQLQADEILEAIEIPLDLNKQIHYEKLAIRKTLDFASVGVAVAINYQSEKNVLSNNFKLEIALTGIQTLPGYFSYSSNDFESVEKLLDKACEQANQFSLIYQQDFFPRAYRQKMISVFIRRCFNQLISRA